MTSRGVQFGGPTLGLAAVACLVLGASACSTGSSQASGGFEDRLVSASQKAAESEDGFSLPRSTPGSRQWTQGVAVCPYATSLPDAADERFESAFSKLDTSDDSSQWLLLRTGDTVETVELGRDVDFCSDASESGMFGPESRFAAQADDGTVVVSPWP